MKTFALGKKYSFNYLLLKIVIALFLGSLCPALGNQESHEPLAQQAMILDCTVYYTPKESGFISGKGFDLRPVTRSGLQGRKFPADFLRAVQMEGYGLIVQPQGTNSYIYYNGAWGYTAYPRGTKQIRLVPLQSSAVSIKSFRHREGNWLKPLQHQLPAELAKAVWKIVDVGGGVRPQQIDLYWGEDNPRGPGQDIYRPAGTNFTGRRSTHFATAPERYAFQEPLSVSPFFESLLTSNFNRPYFDTFMFDKDVQ
jgi:hypothetical protein